MAEYEVVENGCGRLALWDSRRRVPSGWSRIGISGSIAECREAIADLSDRRVVQRSGSPDTLLSRFREICVKHADRMAVADSSTELTYSEFWSAVTHNAQRLRTLGVKRGDGVAIVMKRSAMLPIAVASIWAIGGYYVGVDPSYPSNRRRAMVQSSGAIVQFLDTDAPDDNDLPQVVVEFSPEVAPIPGWELTESDSSELAYVLFTSGSTGEPKPVAIEHRQLTSLFDATADLVRWEENGCWLMLHSLAFDFSVWEIWAPLLNGCAVYVADADEVASTARLWDAICRRRITSLSVTPSHFAALADAARESASVHGLRLIVFGGEALRAEHLRSWRKLSPPNTQLVNMYGITETTVHVTAHALEREEGEEVDPAIGRPLANATIYLLDQHLRRVPPGSGGEIYVSGSGLARGYHRRPDLTAERFVPDPYGPPGTVMYRSGDSAWEALDGVLHYLGRLDDQVQVRGYRVELNEVRTLLSKCPGVRGCAVWYDADRECLRAAVTVEDGFIDHKALFDLLRAELPPWMIPGSIETLDELPRDANGKLDTSSIPFGVEMQLKDEPSHELPRTSVGLKVIEAWREVLGYVPTAHNVDLFTQGGTSLDLARIQSKLERSTGLRLPILQMYTNPTVEGMVSVVEGAAEKSQGLQDPDHRHRSLFPLTHGQMRLWFLSLLEESRAAYVSAIVFDLVGELDLDRLDLALRWVLNRHAQLRAVLVVSDGTPAQKIPPSPGSDQISIVTVAGVECWWPEDLPEDLLFRFIVAVESPTRSRLFVQVSHLVFDAVTEGILWHDLSIAYQNLPETEPMPPAIARSYSDYVHWEAEWLESTEYREMKAEWAQRLSNLPPPLPLRSAKPDAVPAPARVQRIEFSQIEAQAIRARARQLGISVFMLAYASLHSAIERVLGRTDIIVGAPVAARPTTLFETVIGFFANTIPIRLNSSAIANPAYFSDVRRACLEALAGQYVPFDEVVRAAGIPASDEWPLIQIMLNYQDLRSDRLDFGQGLRVRAVPLGADAVRVPIAIYGEPTDSGMSWKFVVDGMLDTGVAEGLLAEFVRQLRCHVDRSSGEQ